MNYYLTACGLILHTVFWGAGLAMIALPGRWRRFWWTVAPGCGFALQSAVVWTGAQTSLAGTDAYAWASEVVPAALLVLGVRRLGREAVRHTNWRPLAALAAIGLVAGWLMLSPMTVASRGLTSTSLGSCDHADYAAGARVFKEFSRHDRTGFLGLPEVTRVRSAEHFFEFWVRLNHFTPSALLAHNGTILGLEPYQSVSLTAAVVVLLNLPIVLLLARVVAGLRGVTLLAVVATFALSPIQAYAVHHGALGQLYAAQGIAWLTVAVVGAGRWEMARRSGRSWLPAMVAAVWLLAGSYNFILTVCLAPAAAWLVAETWRRDRPEALLRTAGWLLVAVGVVVAGAWGRFDGLWERFGLFEQYNFGWTVPLASPEGWVGLVRTVHLDAWPVPVRAAVGGVVVAAWLAGVVVLWRRDRARALLVGALVLPVIAGWGLLAWETRERANASYDAYKILSVFYPGLLAGLWAGMAALGRMGRGSGKAVGALLAVMVAGNAQVAWQYRERMQDPPLRVDRELVQLGSLERNAQVESLNVRIADFWSRLWANSLLLRKPQYFETHTYEGRLNTELKGTWDLDDAMLRAVPLDPADVVKVNDRYQAVRVGTAGKVAVSLGEGWHAEERLGAMRWRWAGERGELVVENPGRQALRVRLMVKVRSVEAGALLLGRSDGQGGEGVASAGQTSGGQAGARVLARAEVSGAEQDVVMGEVVVMPGRTVLELRTEAAARRASPQDGRLVSFALFGAEVAALGWVEGRPE